MQKAQMGAANSLPPDTLRTVEAGCRKIGGWPVTPRMQQWIGAAAGIPAGIGIIAATSSLPVMVGGGLIAVMSLVPHEYLHYLAARSLGMRAQIHWTWRGPHTQSEGVLRMAQIPYTTLAPQIIEAALIVGAVAARSPILAVAAITHATMSVGDYTHAACAAVMSVLPRTRNQLLLNSAGAQAGLYEPMREIERQHAPKEVVKTDRYKAAQPEAPEGRQVMQFRIYPDHWKAFSGLEPSLGPIEAPDARSAYREARDRGMYPAGVTSGLRAVALDEYGQLAPALGVWGGTQETPEWAAYERSLDLGEGSKNGLPVATQEVRSTPHMLEASGRTSPTEEKEAHGPMQIEVRKVRLMKDRTDNLLAVCNLNLGGEFELQGVRVMKGKDGKPFVSLPSYQEKNGEYREVTHPVTARARAATNRIVLEEFQRHVKLQNKVASGPER